MDDLRSTIQIRNRRLRIESGALLFAMHFPGRTGIGNRKHEPHAGGRITAVMHGCGRSAATSPSEPTLDLVTIGSVRIGVPGRLPRRARPDMAPRESRALAQRDVPAGLAKVRHACRALIICCAPCARSPECPPSGGFAFAELQLVPARLWLPVWKCAMSLDPSFVRLRQAPVCIEDPSTRSSSDCVVEPARQALGEAAQHHICAVSDHRRAQRLDPLRRRANRRSIAAETPARRKQRLPGCDQLSSAPPRRPERSHPLRARR
jgi:hypothetical protein